MNIVDEFGIRTGEVIQELRNRAGLKQEDLARAVGLSRTSISNIEAGRQKLLFETFYKIAVALDTPPSRLVSRIMNQPEGLTYTKHLETHESDDTASYIYDNFIHITKEV